MAEVGYSRRRFLTGLGVGAGAGAAALATGTPLAHGMGREQAAEAQDAQSIGDGTVAFDGRHQAGISTPEQAAMWMLAFTLKPGLDRSRVRGFMRTWTDDARRMSRGQPAIAELEPEMIATPSDLTFTVGFGPRFFDVIGLPEQRPEWLAPLPKYSLDQLEEKWGDGDVVMQICCNDPMTLSHAARYMIRNAEPFADVHWVQTGFAHGAGVHEPGATPRNRFGQLDGTVNPRSTDELDDIVWINDGPKWLIGGTSMVVRRIHMEIETWEILDRVSREESTGRHLASGAPLGMDHEHDVVDLDRRDSYGLPVIDANSHVARSMPADGKPGLQVLRRPYTYDTPPTDGVTPDTGLVFISFQKDPLEQYHPIQQRLDDSDRLNEWIRHIGSAVFVIPPGTTSDGYWGEDLLAE